jgi:RNA polymerase sigma factor (sigma-70 family)
MSLVDEFRMLQKLSERLPFALDDPEQANATFVRWREGDASARRIVDLYAYLYGRRYFLTKFISNRRLPPTEYELLATRAFERTMNGIDRVREADKFTSWLSVICSNLFRSHLKRRPSVSNLDAEAEAQLVGDGFDPSELDRGAVKTALIAAILRLPDYLGEIAQLRLIDRLSYPQIAERTGHAEGTLRSYVNKAVARIRTDHDLRDLYHG